MAAVEVRFTRPVEGWKAGARVWVEDSPRIQKMAKRGYVDVVGREREAATPERPGLNASRDVWVKYSQGLGLDVWEGARRADIVADVDAWLAGERVTVVGEAVPEDSREPDTETGAVEDGDEGAE